MKIHDPGASQAMQKDYDATDIERLMGKRDWKNDDEVDFRHEPDQLYKRLKSSR